jgi:hypothetical protein
MSLTSATAAQSWSTVGIAKVVVLIFAAVFTTQALHWPGPYRADFGKTCLPAALEIVLLWTRAGSIGSRVFALWGASKVAPTHPAYWTL